MQNALEITLLHLSLIPGIGPATIEQLTKRFTLEQLLNIYSFSTSDFIEQFGISERLAEKLVSGLADKKILDKELELLEKYHISWATLVSNSYPVLLKTIHLAPTILYWQGHLESTNENSIACVGSRKANKYGSDVIDYLIPELVAHTCTIISGGALGIDTLAHQATIKHKGITYAILGSGLLRPYPSQNNKLFQDIVSSGGAVISSFSLQQEPLAGNFPARNRIIAGLSKACLVIQAAEKSGALITARYALDQGREVCAVPGSIIDPLSHGCNKLIAQGATPVLHAQDIVRALGCEHVHYEQQLIVGQMGLSEKLKSLCKTPTSFDDLNSLGLCSEQELQEELFSLQLLGKIEQNFMGLWGTI